MRAQPPWLLIMVTVVVDRSWTISRGTIMPTTAASGVGVGAHGQLLAGRQQRIGLRRLARAGKAGAGVDRVLEDRKTCKHGNRANDGSHHVEFLPICWPPKSPPGGRLPTVNVSIMMCRSRVVGLYVL